MKQAEVSASWRGRERAACDRDQTKPEVTELWCVKGGGSGRAVLRGKKGGAGEGLGLLSGGLGGGAGCGGTIWSADEC